MNSLEGKLFVEFVALIYLSYINKKMEDGHLYSRYTMHELLDELDVIECYLEPGKAPIQGEVLMKQPYCIIAPPFYSYAASGITNSCPL